MTHIREKLFENSKDNFDEDFQEIGELGKGAFGICILCKHRQTQLTYAVKKVLKGRLISDSMRLVVITEVNIQSHLKGHRNIVQILDTYEDGEYVYIVQELCEGGDLFDHLIAKGRYSERDSADLCRAMLMAVEHCHKSGVMHRDLKPDNFLFSFEEPNSKDAILKTADFGLSCFHTPGTRESQPCGTPTYIAPEVIRKDYDEKADIWSVGVILYIMLSGKMPFYGRTDTDCLRSTLSGRYSFQHRNWETVSEAAKEIVAAMLRYNPSDRPSATELLEYSWIRGNASTKPLVQSVIDNMKQFSNMNKLKKRAMQIMAESTKLPNLHEVQKAFREMDRDGSGTITVDEMRDALEAVNKNFSEEYFEQLWDTYDVDGDGVIDYTEFLTATSQLNKLLTAENMEKAFKEIDKDGSGTITVSEIKEALKNFNCDNQMFEQIMAEADKNKDGVIDYDEFEEMMQKREDLHVAADELKGLLNISDLE
mmetsp:Transcript_2730/g.12183  ORF Transcript_2730/g.12183 Transcript_2730/m.12183 type:complete len:481 (-) Transcript_2730:3040-4482(-)|eukprot:CAMPEP_0113959198 /NCGR_PEP_ID=MMETSP0011_2-20120614/4005_1 /TAXON_ID=101924 /ORGANISM="Rhodosorus marinus" /LENGTH=480 /DNA_ID=CAMNT_0000970471 /DNA_START=282 /DNA_END=1724 /DNA_ORIENTATION=+ /assembly_acc=CAM_ASM_000156